MEKKTEKIVNELINNPDTYKAKSEEEGRVWGKVLSNKKWVKAQKKDQQEAAKLNFQRHQIHIVPTLKKHNIVPVKGLSLACGNGRAERNLMQAGCCENFHGIDIAEVALQSAREAAEKERLNITYEQSDLNSVNLPENEFDLVVTQNCLHHILKLEHLAEEIKKTLKPGGVLWISDFIGESQFQYTEERMEIVNKIRSILPRKFMFDTVNDRWLNEFVRPEPGKLISPFEAIRSADIMPVFLEHFDVVESSEFDCIMKYVCPVGTRKAYNRNVFTRAIFELLMSFDEILIKHKVLTPIAGTFLLQVKK